jgi:predicted nucleic acid-binding protein
MIQLYNDATRPRGDELNIAIDASVVLAVLLGEPSRERILGLTSGADLVAPASLPWEVGNALSALVRRGRLDGAGASEAFRAWGRIRVRLPEIDMEAALALACEQGAYAYDAYVLECARRYRAPLLSLDAAQCRLALALGIEVLEV